MVEMKYRVDAMVSYPFHLDMNQVRWCNRCIGEFDLKWDRVICNDTVHMLFLERNDAFRYWLVWS